MLQGVQIFTCIPGVPFSVPPLFEVIVMRSPFEAIAMVGFFSGGGKGRGVSWLVS